ncbi:hypothetical protein V6N13_144862 [Hibiscus sabdariffa]|uniref:RNase H type-1 domain-containing protein n=1 Tax=Hibiscus sabdariffa TaxID=183260 RepID=A0ABR2FLQ5_9ROSI
MLSPRKPLHVNERLFSLKTWVSDRFNRGDSLSVFKKVTFVTFDKSVISPIIRDILSLRNLFQSVTFTFVGKIGNETAHMLAKLGIQHPETRIWVEEALASVELLAMRERPP